MTANLLVEAEKLSDADILALSAKQPAVFAVLVERWRSRLFSRAARITGSPDEAEDIVQETFVRVYKYAAKYEPQEGAGFSAWLYRIFYNVCWSHQARRTRQNAFVSASDESVSGTSIEFADPSFTMSFERLLDIDEITSMLKRLPAAAARLIKLYVLEGKSYEELATLEGVSVGTVRVRVHRARRDFQKVFSRVETGVSHL